MPKEKPGIVGAVRVNGKVYRAGDEAALEKDLRSSKTSLDPVRLARKGVITGVDIPADDDEAGSEPNAEVEGDESDKDTTEK